MNYADSTQQASTAAETYESAKADCLAILAELAELMSEDVTSPNWGHAGSMVEARKQLVRMLGQEMGEDELADYGYGDQDATDRANATIAELHG